MNSFLNTNGGKRPLTIGRWSWSLHCGWRRLRVSIWLLSNLWMP